MKKIRNKINANKKLILILLVLSLSLLFSTVVYAITFTGKGCDGNQVCDTKIDCDLTGNCNTQYSNCVSCGTTTMSCPGGVASCQNPCEQIGTSAQCSTCVPDCSNLQVRISDPHVILKFTVFTKKDFITVIEPKKQTGLAGSTMNYKVSLENKHPKSIALKLGVEVPTSWTSSLKQDIEMGANTKRDISFAVTSSKTASDGQYTVSFVAFSPELGVFDSISTTYEVASRGAPTISIEPSTQEGAPGQVLSYTVSVANNDPADFDPSYIDLMAFAPDKWVVDFESSAIELSPGETGTTVLYVTSPETAEINSYTINVNAIANQLTASGFTEYKLTFCGNGICEADEVCSKDCIPETDFICNGRCEREIDDGVEFSAIVNFLFRDFVVCKKGTTTSNCISSYKSNSCGFGQPCLCGNKLTSLCRIRCVDSKGAYFLYAKDGVEARSRSNYSFACPFVDLPEIIRTRNDLDIARAKYEQARSAFIETIAMDVSERVKMQPCIDALNLIIKNLTAHISYMDAVINSPAKSNTTEARRRTNALRNFIEVTYNKYCRGAQGLLRIEKMSPPGATEKGKIAAATVVVSNLASFDYYGYLECDFVPPGGDTIITKSECTPVLALKSKTIRPAINVSYEGEWKMKCRIYASLEPDCSTEIHDETGYVTFNVFSKDVYVVDVSGQCQASDILCTVRTNSETDCVGCKINGVACSKVYENGTIKYFSCPRSGFYANLTGYVYTTSMCNPLVPIQKSITVHCPGCGDNITQSNEQCEMPNTDNNVQCSQTQTGCEGKRHLYRDQYGFCAPSCQCSADQYTSICLKNTCGATCSDGETKNKTITNPDGTCICVQDCNSTCGWADCYCEPVPLPSIEVLGVSVSDSCPEENTNIDVWCALSEPRVNCMKAKIGNTICEWTNNSYWFNNNAVFKDCFVGMKTNTACGQAARNVLCYIDRTKCTQKGANKTLGIDVLSAAKPPAPSAPCSAKITSKNCSYDSIANKYNVYLGVEWSGGSYSRGSIESVESNKYTISKFVYSMQSNNAGTKQLTAYVFDNGNNILCTNSTSVYCTPEAVGPTITDTSVQLLGISVSESCPTEKTNISVTCRSSIPKVDCIRAKIGNTVCEWTDRSYWYGDSAIFRDCYVGTRTNTECGDQSREVRCYIDKTKCVQIGSDKTLGIDVMKEEEAAKKCSVEITSKACSYDPVVKKYTSAVGVKWSNGDHAHAKIDNYESIRYIDSEFTYTYQFGTPGTKTLQAYVHDKDHRVLCYVTENIYCGAGNTTGIGLDVVRHMPDIAHPGWIDVKFDIIPYKMVQNFELQEYVKKDLVVEGRKIEGNISATTFGGPSTVSEAYEDFHMYSWRTDLEEGRNATISYRIKIDEEGEYRFIAKAKFFGQEKKYERYLFVTTCLQITPVLARNPTTGDCTQFKTSCDAAKMGYETVETCVEPQPYVPPPEGFDWAALIIVIIIAVILAFVWIKREEIKEKIDEWRSGKEEEPSEPEFP